MKEIKTLELIDNITRNVIDFLETARLYGAHMVSQFIRNGVGRNDECAGVRSIGCAEQITQGSIAAIVGFGVNGPFEEFQNRYRQIIADFLIRKLVLEYRQVEIEGSYSNLQ